jgi:hypothetical protein
MTKNHYIAARCPRLSSGHTGSRSASFEGFAVDGTQFDALVKRVSVRVTRRATLVRLNTLGFAGLAFASSHEAASAKKKRKKRKKKAKAPPPR